MKQRAITTVSMQQVSLWEYPDAVCASCRKKAKSLLVLLLFCPCLLLFPALDNDLWFLSQVDAMSSRIGVPTVEPFTLHPNMAFVVRA